MAKAAQLSVGDPDQEVAPEKAAHPDPLRSQGSNLPTDIQADVTEKAVQDPPTSQEKWTQDSVPSSEVVLMEEENAPAGSEVPEVEGIQASIVAEVVGADATGQEEHIEEERDA